MLPAVIVKNHRAVPATTLTLVQEMSGVGGGGGGWGVLSTSNRDPGKCLRHYYPTLSL